MILVDLTWLNLRFTSKLSSIVRMSMLRFLKDKTCFIGIALLRNPCKCLSQGLLFAQHLLHMRTPLFSWANYKSCRMSSIRFSLGSQIGAISWHGPLLLLRRRAWLWQRNFSAGNLQLIWHFYATIELMVLHVAGCKMPSKPCRAIAHSRRCSNFENFFLHEFGGSSYGFPTRWPPHGLHHLWMIKLNWALLWRLQLCACGARHPWRFPSILWSQVTHCWTHWK